MKKIAVVLIAILGLAACATPHLDRLLYEDQINANNRNYLLYRENKEWGNQDKVSKGQPPDTVLSQEAWQKTQAPDKFVENYERKHGIVK